MKTKDFKLIIENFQKFLMNEHTGHTAQCTRLFAAIPHEFSDYINSNSFWYNGDAWTAEVDHCGNAAAEADHMLFFEEVAAALGCLTYKDESQPDGTIETKPCFENMLVNFDDNYREDFSSPNPNVQADDLLNSYTASGQGSLNGSFKIGNAELSGFYYRLGTTCGLEGQFQDNMSARSLRGMLFVAPNCSGGTTSSGSKESSNFKGVLGGVWG